MNFYGGLENDFIRRRDLAAEINFVKTPPQLRGKLEIEAQIMVGIWRKIDPQCGLKMPIFKIFRTEFGGSQTTVFLARSVKNSTKKT